MFIKEQESFDYVSETELIQTRYTRFAVTLKDIKGFISIFGFNKVTKTPSTFDGAQYNFVDLLKEKAEMEVSYVNA